MDFSFARGLSVSPSHREFSASPVLALHSPTVRRQEGALPPNRCQHELEVTLTVAQISIWSLDKEGPKTQFTSATNSGTVKLRGALLTAKQTSHSLFI